MDRSKHRSDRTDLGGIDPADYHQTPPQNPQTIQPPVMTATVADARFASISAAAPDAILGLTEAFLADPNPEKMNLSVGVYKNAEGITHIMRCVKLAEQRLVETESTKGYLPIDGHADYRHHLCRLIFGDAADHTRVAAVQSPGGTGGLRVAAAFVGTQMGGGQMGGATVWMSNPTWANHKNIFAAENVPIETYGYLTDDRRSLDFGAMIDDLKTKPSAGDVVLLHACCHNPTGIDPTDDQWQQIAEVLSERRLIPLLDFAYQGFGRGIDQDAAAIRTVMRHCDEMIVCNSFSKNFGLYSERVGGISVLARDADTADIVRSQLKRLIRSNYSNPPRHGAAVVATILDDAELTEIWQTELSQMRDRIHSLRQSFVQTMANTGSGHDFGFLNQQSGMFSYSGLTPMQVDQLKNQHSIYMVGSGRINVAGMTEARMQTLCNAVASVL